MNTIYREVKRVYLMQRSVKVECCSGLADVVKTRFHNLRTAFRKSLMLVANWHATPSSTRKGRPPRPYVYQAELGFLEEIFKIENTRDLINSANVKLSSYMHVM